ncbi:MAG: hypothetical protein KKH32_05675 [Bacteroidetes bacterium]|nr:hypothetical protein [Bacteroidota bacterium]
MSGIREILYCTNRAESNLKLKQLRNRFGPKYSKVFNLIDHHLTGLLNHQKDNLIPKTNNLAENKN